MNTNPRMFCDPVAHLKFSGGNYFKHFWFGFRGVCILGVAFITGLVHIIFPFLFPFVADGLCIYLGKQCEEHRKSEAERRRKLELFLETNSTEINR